MSNTSRTLRLLLRWIHLVSGSLVATVIYSPLRESEAFVLLVQIILLPVIILTGISMWQQARLRRLLGRSSGGRTQ